MVGVYICLSCLVDWSRRNELKKITNLTNLSQINLFLAVVLSSFLFSLAGIPPFSGFFYKFYLLNMLVGQNLFNLGLFLFCLYTISIFYYLRIIKLIFLNTSFNWILLKPFSKFKIFFLICLFWINIFFFLLQDFFLNIFFEWIL